MEAIKGFSTKQSVRRKEEVWMRKKNITQSYVFWKGEVDERVKALENVGWTRIEKPKSILVDITKVCAMLSKWKSSAAY